MSKMKEINKEKIAWFLNNVRYFWDEYDSPNAKKMKHEICRDLAYFFFALFVFVFLKFSIQ